MTDKILMKDKIKALRMALKLFQKDFAELISKSDKAAKSARTVRSWECGERYPSRFSIEAMKNLAKKNKISINFNEDD